MFQLKTRQNLSNERAGFIGVNVRPLRTTIALTNLNAKFITPDSFPTNPDLDVFLSDLTERIQNLLSSQPRGFCEGIGVGVPGRVGRRTQKLVFAPDLGGRDVDIKGFLEAKTNLTVEVDNAANSCALGELWFGRHAEEVHGLIALTVSEGIGTGIIANDQLICGGNGMAGEFGHVSIKQDGIRCSCGNHGCWEFMLPIWPPLIITPA